MQDIKVAEVKILTGKTSGKEYYKVVDDKGGEYSTFDPNIKAIMPGSILSAEIKVEGKYVNLLSWTLKAKPQETEPLKAATGNEYKQTDWNKRDEITRLSIESQTAYNGIIELLKTGIPVPEDLKSAAMNWAMIRLSGKPLKTETPKAETHFEKMDKKPEVVKTPQPGFTQPAEGAKPLVNKQTNRDIDSIKNMTELYKACNQDFDSMQPAKVLELLGVKSVKEITDLPGVCYVTIFNKINKVEEA